MKSTCTKVVATVGPASGTPALIGKLIEAGVDVFRLNFSHGDHAAHEAMIGMIRAEADRREAPVAVLQDLQGPRIRTGRLKNGTPVQLAAGDETVFRTGDFEGDSRLLAVTYDRFARDLVAGDRVLIADGRIELAVLESDGTSVRCRIITGGELGEHKGINLPGARLSIAAPTEKDIEDLRFGIERGVDWVALSFVEKADDILQLKKAMTTMGRSVPVIAKIERPQAVQNLHDILLAADGVMVARGDMGIEMSPEAVPAAQKHIIAMANRHCIPVITATQMLESMIESPRPTRAEASDVANAILDGTDAVMLSGETSVGRYPAEAVAMMESIAANIEELRHREHPCAAPDLEDMSDTSQTALARAACDIACRLQARAIATFTMTGATARYLSQRRPDTPICALTPNRDTFRRLALVWGVQPVLIDMFATTDEMIEKGSRRLRQLHLVAPGDTVVFIAGRAIGAPGSVDLLKIERID